MSRPDPPPPCQKDVEELAFGPGERWAVFWGSCQNYRNYNRDPIKALKRSGFINRGSTLGFLSSLGAICDLRHDLVLSFLAAKTGSTFGSCQGLAAVLSN